MLQTVVATRTRTKIRDHGASRAIVQARTGAPGAPKALADPRSGLYNAARMAERQSRRTGQPALPWQRVHSSFSSSSLFPLSARSRSGGTSPLAAGCLKLGARRAGIESRCDLEIVPASIVNWMGDASLAEHIAGRRPFVVGFTCYLWNVDRTLWIAERVKQLSPGTRVVLGGPEI